MKRFVFSLFLLSLSWFPLISYWNDCSGYDELISITEQQINALKMKSARDWMTLTNQLDRAYAPISSKYQSEYDSLKANYNDYVNKKYDCLMNASLSSISNSSNTSNTTTSNSVSSNKKYFKEYLDTWITKAEANNYSSAANYLEKAYSYCNKSDIKSTYAELCNLLPKMIETNYLNWCTLENQQWNYIKAKEYCLKTLDYNSNSFYAHIWLWMANFLLWEYKIALDQYWIAKKVASSSEEKELAERYYNIAEKRLQEPEISDEVRAILDSIGTSDSWDSSNNNQQTKLVTNDKDNLITKLENMKEWETLEVSVQCDEWYIIDETQTKCVKDSLNQRKLNCTTWFWENSELSKENNDDCVCKEWYMMNASETKCIPYSAEQMKANCEIWYWEHSVVAEVTKCNCEEGYTWSYDETFCDVDLDQKSLASRMVNTLDAKCDTDSVINACKDDPTGDACPAVCLEVYDAINWMYDNELTIFKDPKQFGIYNEMTREQASKFFVNFYKTVFNKTLAVPMKNPFNDIANADPTLYNYIQYAYGLNLFKGNNWKFMPFNHLSKAQSLAVIIRMPYWVLDETVNPWYMNYLYKWEGLKLLDNIKYSQSTLDSEDILRGDVALMLYRLYIYLTYMQ